MRIHSDILTHIDPQVAIRLAGLSGIVEVRKVEPRNSRLRRRAYEVALGGLTPAHRRPTHDNTARAATYDEHSRWFAELFRLDPDVIVGPYRGVDAFRTMTGGKYE